MRDLYCLAMLASLFACSTVNLSINTCNLRIYQVIEYTNETLLK